MCGSFSCSKSTLIALNIVYVMIAFLLIGVATYGKTSNIIVDLPIVGGIVASGVFLLGIALVGLWGAMKHHQVGLFAYMVVLFAIFIIQFSVSCACLAVSKDDELDIASKAWIKVAPETKFAAEQYFSCCGFNSNSRNTSESDGYNCDLIKACNNTAENGTYACPSCKDKIEGKIGYAFSSAGGVGLFFSFTEFVAIVYAFKFRKQLTVYAA